MHRLKQIFFSLNHKEKKILSAAILLTIVSVIGLSIALIRKSTWAMPTSGGNYTEGMLGQPASVNPLLATTPVDKTLVRLIFSSLGDLSEQIDQTEEGGFKIRIKNEVVWSDGEKLTSDDIIFTLERIQDEDTRSSLWPIFQGVKAKRLSELEIQIEPVQSLTFDQELKNLYILPKHIFEDVPTSNWRISDYSLSPIGSGYFKFIEFNKDKNGFINHYKLAANPNYFGEKALLQNLNFRFFKDKEDLFAAFNQGLIQGLGGIEPQELSKIERPAQEIIFKSPGYYAIFMNQSRNDLLRELAVRKALDKLAPKRKILEEVLLKKGSIRETPWPYFLETTTNNQGAEEILESAGWVFPTLDEELESETSFLTGIRYKTISKEKTPLILNLTVPEIPFLIQAAEIFQQAAKEKGIKINLNITPEKIIEEEIIKNRDYEMLFYGNKLDKNLDLFYFWHSSQKFYPGLNLALYSNSKIDSLLENYKEATNETTGQDYLKQAAALIKNDYPAIFLFSPDYIYLTHKDLKGINGNLIEEPQDRFSDILNWHLKTVRVLK